MSRPDLTDEEVDEICAGLVQSAAKIRFLRRLGLHVDRKPNGRPLVNREHYNRVRARSAIHLNSDPLEGAPTWGVH